MALLAAPLSLAGVAAVGVVAGFGLELFNVLWITVLQQRISDDVLARVNSYDALGPFVFIPLGLTVAGPVAAAVGVSTALWGAAAVASVTVLLPLFSRDVRSLRRVEDGAAPAATRNGAGRTAGGAFARPLVCSWPRSASRRRHPARARRPRRRPRDGGQLLSCG